MFLRKDFNPLPEHAGAFQRFAVRFFSVLIHKRRYLGDSAIQSLHVEQAKIAPRGWEDLCIAVGCNY
jgi:hypothetical protein